MAAIDKLLRNNAFEQKYPLAFVTAKVRAGSDRVPLILDCGANIVKKNLCSDLKNGGLNS